MADPLPAAPKQVPVFTPGLGVRMVDAEDAPAAIAGGARVASEAEHHEAKMEDRYSGLDSTAAAVLAGAGRGVTLGGTDYLAGAIGGEGLKRKLLDYQKYNATASTVGEIGGIAATALLGDEAGLANLPGLVGRVGAGAGRATAKALGGGLLARGAGALARGGVEGAIYATGKAEGEASLQDQQLTMEQAVAAAGHGALFGAGANALFAGAGHALESVGGLRAPRIGAAAEAEAGSLRGRLGEELQKGADVKTIKALGGSAGDLRSLEASTPGGFRKVAQDIRGDVEVTTGKSIGLHNKESLHEYATQRVDELGDKLGGMLKKLDESGGAVAPDVKGFAAKVHKDLVAPHVVPQPGGGQVVLPGQEAGVEAAQKWVASVEKAFGDKPPTFTQWQKMRVGLDKDINFAARNASPEMTALKQVRSIMEKELETSGEAAAKNVGTSFADQYQATKSLYQSVRKAQELTERGVARELANNSFGLGATMSALTGAATGGPVVGAAMGIAGKVVKDRGDMFAADLLSRAANLVGIQKLAGQTSARIANGAAAITGTKALATGAQVLPGQARSVAAPLGVALSGNQRKDFQKVSEAITQASTNPAHTIDRLAGALGPEAGKSPGLSAAGLAVLMKGVNFLQSKLPPTRQDPFSIQPQLQQESRASDAEISKFMRYAEAVDNPTMVLAEAKNGTLSRDHVEAVKEVYPKLYAQMQQQVMEQLVTSKSQLPYGKRIQLGILLDIPTDRTLAPDFQQAIQATYSSAEQAGEETPPPQLSRPLAIASSLSTPLVGATTEGLEK